VRINKPRSNTAYKTASFQRAFSVKAAPLIEFSALYAAGYKIGEMRTAGHLGESRPFPLCVARRVQAQQRNNKIYETE
jgi:hypothetical protein